MNIWIDIIIIITFINVIIITKGKPFFTTVHRATGIRWAGERIKKKVNCQNNASGGRLP